jgi:hypothetical protein
MPWNHSTSSVGIYLLPAALTSLDREAKLARSRAFIEAFLPKADAGGVVVFDDHDMPIEIEEQFFFDVAHGDVPAFHAAFDAATQGELKALLVPEAGALRRLPAAADHGREELRRLRRTVEAVPVEVLRPARKGLDALSRGKPDAWRTILEAVGDHRLTEGAPECFVKALFGRLELDDWEEVVLRAATGVIEDRIMAEQTTRLFMEWLDKGSRAKARGYAKGPGVDEQVKLARRVIARRSGLAQKAITDETPLAVCGDLDDFAEELRGELGADFEWTGDEVTAGDLFKLFRAQDLLGKVFGY